MPLIGFTKLIPNIHLWLRRFPLFFKNFQVPCRSFPEVFHQLCNSIPLRTASGQLEHFPPEPSAFLAMNNYLTIHSDNLSETRIYSTRRIRLLPVSTT